MMVDDADPNSELVGATKQMNELDAFSFIEPGGRLVEQELRRASAERHGYAETPQVAEWHRVGDLVGERLEADKLKQLLRRRPLRSSAVCAPRSVLDGDLNVLTQR